ncbi:hypothetical protein PIB30_106782, partial [Stylosanthes scabra]|nr:hypothetical protein [Stylosanthes scabra]
VLSCKSFQVDAKLLVTRRITFVLGLVLLSALSWNKGTLSRLALEEHVTFGSPLALFPITFAITFEPQKRDHNSAYTPNSHHV